MEWVIWGCLTIAFFMALGSILFKKHRVVTGIGCMSMSSGLALALWKTDQMHELSLAAGIVLGLSLRALTDAIGGGSMRTAATQPTR